MYLCLPYLSLHIDSISFSKRLIKLGNYHFRNRNAIIVPCSFFAGPQIVVSKSITFLEGTHTSFFQKDFPILGKVFPLFRCYAMGACEMFVAPFAVFQSGQRYRFLILENDHQKACILMQEYIKPASALCRRSVRYGLNVKDFRIPFSELLQKEKHDNLLSIKGEMPSINYGILFDELLRIAVGPFPL